LTNEYADRIWQWRLPNSRDLRELHQAQSAGEPMDVRRALLAKCLTAVTALDQAGTQENDLSVLRGGVAEFPPHVVDSISESMEEADSSVQIRLRLACDACGHAWMRPFDMLSYLWTELDVFCRRVLFDVHRLARAYGWSERDILELPPWRRHMYLQLVRE
jgi:hypothetical protein